MDQTELVARHAQLIIDELANPEEGIHWLSFADPDRPEGDQFLGVCIVKARGFLLAVEKARALGINPGGEVQGIEAPQDVVSVVAGIPDLLDRLYKTRAEAEAVDTRIAAALAAAGKP